MSVPALRFKSFDDEWKETLVLNFAPLQRGFDLPVSTIVKGKFPVVFSNGILKHHKEYKAIGPGVVTGRSGTIGNVTYVEENYWPHNTSLWVTDFKNNIPKFVYYFYIQFDLSKLGTGSGVPTLNRNDVHSKNILIPSKPEQTKIANFLTAVDEKIHLLTQKHDLLSQYKKGVMQQIFSQELRFKDNDGQDFPEWEDFLLKNALIKNSAKNKNIEFTLVQSISNKHGFINQDELFEDRVIASKDLSNYYIIRKGAFAYNPSRIDVGSLAYKSDDLISVVSPLYVSFYSKSNLINDSFLFNWFDSEQFKNQMNSSFEGSVRNTLSYDALSKILVVLPSIKEQTKIANFLTAIDDKITATQTQLQAVKQYKQGLLQQMFV